MHTRTAALNPLGWGQGRLLRGRPEGEEEMLRSRGQESDQAEGATCAEAEVTVSTARSGVGLSCSLTAAERRLGKLPGS